MKETYTELYEKLTRLQWLLHRSHMQNHAEHGPFADPTRGQGRVLAALKMQPEITTKDMSYLLGIRQQSLNELLNKLEKSGYVTREPSQADRRVMVVKLTEKGKNEQHLNRDFSDVFDCLTEDEQRQFAQYLDRIIAALESQLGDEVEEMNNWMQSARSRMGDETFERLMSMRGGMHGAYGQGRQDGRFGHDEFHRFDPRERGPKPPHIPGAERFDPDYDGPIPEGRKGSPFGRGRGKCHHSSEDETH